MREISGDAMGSFGGRLLYLAVNFMRGAAGYRVFYPSHYWHPKDIESGKDSPGRIYVHAFLREMLPNLVVEKKISMLDVGCGSGYIRELFSDIGYQIDYTGMDIVKEKAFDVYTKYTLRSVFVQSDMEALESTQTYDLVFSLCALEHVADDKKAVAGASRAARGVQIWVVPAFWAFFLYLWHGYRQYSPKRLRDVFGEVDVTVYRVGGLFSFLLHLSAVTLPEVFLKNRILRESPLYEKFVQKSSSLDRLFPICSSMYIVVIRK